MESRGKALFLSLITTVFLLLTGTCHFIWWVSTPRLAAFDQSLITILLWTLRSIFLLALLGLGSLLFTSLANNALLFWGFGVRTALRLLFPLTVIWGQLLGFKKDKIRESYVFVNNALVKARKIRISPERILVLLPHCLQNYDCPYRITNAVENCINCGKCVIGGLKTIAETYHLHIAVATGGTLARRIIQEAKPQFIIAVACERDLVEGIIDVFPLPVYGILNERPYGPCVNTTVSLEKIKTLLNFLLE